MMWNTQLFDFQLSSLLMKLEDPPYSYKHHTTLLFKCKVGEPIGITSFSLLAELSKFIGKGIIEIL